jgi:divalent metal cation (Fe/Co/Zn/Cd) transporter
MTTQQLERRAWYLSLFTVVYNLAEGILAVLIGAGAGSAALVGFGADSFVESLSGGVMLWRFGRDHEDAERVERKAARLVGYTFFVLAAYVAYDAGRSLLLGERPDATWLGIALAVVSLLVMPALYLAKRRTADRLRSGSLRADSKQTLACTLLSAALLVGLGLNAAFGLWQADSVLGLAIAALLVREGRETLEEGRTCAC